MGIATASVLLLAVVTATSAVQIHMIPHSHQDAGYRETVDGYWRDKVSKTIRTTVKALQEDPRRRFVWEETIWLRYLWESNEHEIIEGFKQLVLEGRIEMIGGGWVMHDEADTSLWSTANQMTIGLDFLAEKLDVRPRWAWHIDPFGHSVTSPSIFSSLGYSAFVINRIPDPEKQQRKENQTLEFIWVGSDNQFPDSQLLAHVLDSHYTTPVIHGSTSSERALDLARQCAERAAWYRTEHVLVPFGSDFRFTNAPIEFAEMDALIDIVNQNPDQHYNVTIQYSTLSEYFEALHNSSSAIFPSVPSGKDFFPYIACSPCSASKCQNVPCGAYDAFWVGYFTSRPHQKLISYRQDAVARALNIMQVIRDVSLVNLTEIRDEELIVRRARNTSGLMQHHDAIPGTSFNYCTISIDECDCVKDYNFRIEHTTNSSDVLLGSLVASVLGYNSNITVLTASEFSRFSRTQPMWTILISNPLAWKIKDVIRLDVPGAVSASVMNLITNHSMLSQVVVDDHRKTSFVYIPVDMNPLSILSLRLQISYRSSASSIPKSYSSSSQRASQLSNGVVTLMFDEASGYPKLWHDIGSGSKSPLSINHIYVDERTPNDTNIFSGTNVYDFTPELGKQKKHNLWPKRVQPTIVANGPIVWEVSIQLNGSTFVSLRLLNASLSPRLFKTLQIQTFTGELPSNSSGSLLLRLSTDINSSIDFFTDSNAFQRKKRSFSSNIPYSGNFYPLVGSAHISDTNRSLSLIAERPTSITSPQAGTLEMMLHRRIMDDDLRGNDSNIMDDTVLATIGSTVSVSRTSARMSIIHMTPLNVHAVPSSEKPPRPYVSPTTEMLSENVHLLDIRRKADGGYGLWLQGLTGTTGGTVNLTNILGGFKGALWSQSSLDFRLSISDTRTRRIKWRGEKTNTFMRDSISPISHLKNEQHLVDVRPESILAFRTNFSTNFLQTSRSLHNKL